MAHFEAFLRDKLKAYKHTEAAVKDARTALEQYKSLKPSVKNYVDTNGTSKDLVCLEGTIPVLYRGATYNIPICIWLQNRHPYIPPYAYVVPTAEMQIKTGKHVDHTGRIFLPFLTDWTHPQSDLYGLIQILCLIFAEQPPVFARTRQGPPPAAHSQRPPYPGYLPVAGTQHGYYHGQPSGGMPQPHGGMPQPLGGGGMPQPLGGSGVPQPHGGMPQPYGGGGIPQPYGGGGMPQPYGGAMSQGPGSVNPPYPLQQPGSGRPPAPARSLPLSYTLHPQPN